MMRVSYDGFDDIEIIKRLSFSLFQLDNIKIGWPQYLPGKTTLTIADLDNDGKNEMITTDKESLKQWSIEGVEKEDKKIALHGLVDDPPAIYDLPDSAWAEGKEIILGKREVSEDEEKRSFISILDKEGRELTVLPEESILTNGIAPLPIIGFNNSEKFLTTHHKDSNKVPLWNITTQQATTTWTSAETQKNYFTAIAKNETDVFDNFLYIFAQGNNFQLDMRNADGTLNQNFVPYRFEMDIKEHPMHRMLGVVGDMNNDGEDEVIITGSTYHQVTSLDKNGTMQWNVELKSSQGQNWNSYVESFIQTLAMGNIDRDPEKEIVLGVYVLDEFSALYSYHLYIINHDGTIAENYPLSFGTVQQSDIDYYFNYKEVANAPVLLGDVDQDGISDIIHAITTKIMLSVSSKPNTSEIWEQLPNNRYINDMILFEDGDKKLNIAVNAYNKYADESTIFIFSLTSTPKTTKIEWPMKHHDTLHTNNLHVMNDD